MTWNQIRVGLTVLPVALLCPMGNLKAQEPSTQLVKALSYSPRQADVNYEKVAQAEQGQCSIEKTRRDGAQGFHITGPADQTLRWFADTNNDDKLDQWSYFNAGVEVYREADTDFNGTADVYRWLAIEGMRKGIDADEDGEIETWELISAEEVTAEVVAATASQDANRFSRLLVTQDELESLGLGKRLEETLAGKARNAKTNFEEWAAGQDAISPKSKWTNFGADKPGLLPAGTDGSTRDVIVYENAVALINDDGTAKQLLVGTLLQVGNAWRVVTLPKTISEGNVLSGEGVVFGMPVAARTADVGTSPVPGISEEMARLVGEFQEIDQELADPGADTAGLHAKRADVIERLVSAAKSSADRKTWIEQFADTVSAAVQTGEYPGGVDRLKRFIKRMPSVDASNNETAYVVFRALTADHNVRMMAPKADYEKLQEAYLKGLKDFVSTYPKSPDSAEAMIQIGLASEFSGEVRDAKTWYTRASADFSGTLAGRKAAGAARRLSLEGRRFSLKAQRIDGGNFDSSAVRNAPVVYHGWATWCEACKAEMRALKQLQDKYAKSNLKIVGINFDSEARQGIEFLKKESYPWVHLFDEGGLDSDLAIDNGFLSLPVNIVVDAKGRVVATGVHWTELDKVIGDLVK
ncbi:MAG: redoxin family protein [Planctomycetota bacterium]|nr:redoxin family protein [Planctomycetota bacterium]